MFWKERAVLRMVLLALLFVCGVALVIHGWTRTGRLSDLGEMLLGLGLLLATLALYNSPYCDHSK